MRLFLALAMTMMFLAAFTLQEAGAVMGAALCAAGCIAGGVLLTLEGRNSPLAYGDVCDRPVSIADYQSALSRAVKHMHLAADLSEKERILNQSAQLLRWMKEDYPMAYYEHGELVAERLRHLYTG